MKILYLSQYFPPEMGAPGARVSEVARHWARAGHDVTVLTGFPNHPTGVVPLEYRDRLRRMLWREELDGIHVVRTWLLPLPNRKTHERILNYGSFCLSACATGPFICNPDIIVATSPQLLVGLSGWWLARWKRVPFIFEVRDLWPESLEAVGVGNRGSMLYRKLRDLANFLYRRCDHIVVVTPAFKDHIAEHYGVNPEKISVIENGVETDLFSSGKPGDTLTPLALSGRFVVSYIGTMGNAHGLETLLGAAAILREHRPEIVFLLLGEGAEKEQLVTQARQRGLQNVIFLDQQPRQQVPAFIAASDVCLVLLKRTDVFKTVIPTKMLEFMACGRPIILGVEGQARQLLEQARAGVAIEPENADELVSAILELYGNSVLRAEMGQNGREYIVSHLSRSVLAGKYLKLLEEAVALRNESISSASGAR